LNEQENEEFEEVVIYAFDMDKLLDFLLSIGLKVTLISHSTLLDFSETYELGLLFEDEPVGAMRIHYIDHHFWPKRDISSEERIAHLMTPSSWNVIVDPVVIVMEKSKKVPESIISQMRNYKDSLPDHPQARKAYEEYMSERRERFE